MPGDRYNPQTHDGKTHGGWGLFESGLVAKSIEPANTSSELAHE
jgi:hypothetical protein